MSTNSAPQFSSDEEGITYYVGEPSSNNDEDNIDLVRQILERNDSTNLNQYSNVKKKKSSHKKEKDGGMILFIDPNSLGSNPLYLPPGAPDDALYTVTPIKKKRRGCNIL